jgi:hypothetical protein
MKLGEIDEADEERDDEDDARYDKRVPIPAAGTGRGNGC